MASISLAVGKRLNRNTTAERFTNSEKANAMLHYEYRAVEAGVSDSNPFRLGSILSGA